MDPRLELIAADITFGESPRWHDGLIWLCDWIDGEVRSIDVAGTNLTVHAHVTGFPICIDWALAGTLIIVDGSAKRLLRSSHGGMERSSTSRFCRIGHGTRSPRIPRAAFT